MNSTLSWPKTDGKSKMLKNEITIATTEILFSNEVLSASDKKMKALETTKTKTRKIKIMNMKLPY